MDRFKCLSFEFNIEVGQTMIQITLFELDLILCENENTPEKQNLSTGNLQLNFKSSYRLKV